MFAHVHLQVQSKALWLLCMLIVALLKSCFLLSFFLIAWAVQFSWCRVCESVCTYGKNRANRYACFCSLTSRRRYGTSPTCLGTQCRLGIYWTTETLVNSVIQFSFSKTAHNKELQMNYLTLSIHCLENLNINLWLWYLHISRQCWNSVENIGQHREPSVNGDK